MSINGEMENKFKVKLVNPSVTTPGNHPERVVFDVTPDVVENRAVNWKPYEPVHQPGQIFVYGSTSSRTFNITGIKLISRTSLEATENMYRLNIIRGWAMPVFGNRAQANLGAPPPVLLLSAYADDNSSFSGNIRRVPVVLSQYSMTYPSDPDYIPTEKSNNLTLAHIPAGIPFPTFTTIEINLNEAHSPREFANFSLADFKQGNLTGF